MRVFRNVTNYACDLIWLVVETPEYILSNDLIILPGRYLEKLSGHTFCNHHCIGVLQACCTVTCENVEGEHRQKSLVGEQAIVATEYFLTHPYVHGTTG